MIDAGEVIIARFKYLHNNWKWFQIMIDHSKRLTRDIKPDRIYYIIDEKTYLERFGEPRPETLPKSTMALDHAASLIVDCDGKISKARWGHKELEKETEMEKVLYGKQ
jgi:hypothetical protein